MTRAELDGHIELDRAVYDALIQHAASDFPYEVCGLLAGPGGRPQRHYRIPNAARSMTAYNMDPKAMLQAFNEIDEHDWELGAIYHSHTHTEAFPSRADLDLAVYPDAVYLIVSLQEREAPVTRAFDIRGGKITERVLTVDGEEAPVGSR